MSELTTQTRAPQEFVFTSEPEGEFRPLALVVARSYSHSNRAASCE